MNNLKNFMARHSFSLGCAAVTLLVASILLVKFSPFFLLLSFLAGVVFVETSNLYFNDWVCTNCGDKAIIQRHKFCWKCGGIMHVVKEERILCLRGHRVEKHYGFCPKCGTRLFSGHLG